MKDFELFVSYVWIVCTLLLVLPNDANMYIEKYMKICLVCPHLLGRPSTRFRNVSNLYTIFNYVIVFFINAVLVWKPMNHDVRLYLIQMMVTINPVQKYFNLILMMLCVSLILGSATFYHTPTRVSRYMQFMAYSERQAFRQQYMMRTSDIDLYFWYGRLMHRLYQSMFIVYVGTLMLYIRNAQYAYERLPASLFYSISLPITMYGLQMHFYGAFLCFLCYLTFMHAACFLSLCLRSRRGYFKRIARMSSASVQTCQLMLQLAQIDRIVQNTWACNHIMNRIVSPFFLSFFAFSLIFPYMALFEQNAVWFKVIIVILYLSTTITLMYSLCCAGSSFKIQVILARSCFSAIRRVRSVAFKNRFVDCFTFFSSFRCINCRWSCFIYCLANFLLGSSWKWNWCCTFNKETKV